MQKLHFLSSESFWKKNKKQKNTKTLLPLDQVNQVKKYFQGDITFVDCLNQRTVAVTIIELFKQKVFKTWQKGEKQSLTHTVQTQCRQTGK